MALMMAGFCPDYFEAIASFVPITDLNRWSQQNEHYSRHILACCHKDAAEMIKRSPISYVNEIARANVKIFHGKYDQAVPVSQSLTFFNTMMEKRPHARVFLDVFDGGHETDEHEALYWLISQYSGVEHASVSS
jgi:dipeptidyl aminopeptidase/acylaminoacyl peptidase